MAVYSGELGLQFTTHIANHYTVPQWVELAEPAHKNNFDQVPLDHGFEVLSLEPKILRQLEQQGLQRAVLPQEQYPRLGGDIQTLDFSGWPLITHRWLPNELAYDAICEAIDARQNVIPVDDDHPLDMKKLCRSLDACPLGIPLHPGAKQYYRENGCL